jgi:hypothetical protein
MSAAATAAGYLYASGRLRGRGKEGGQDTRRTEPEPGAAEHRRVKVAALPDTQPYEPQQAQPPQRPKRAPTVQYRTRRWRPDAGS